MKWFGEPWGAPVNEFTERAPTPVGVPCTYCGQPIAEGDQGFLFPYRKGKDPWLPYHHACAIRSVVGPDAADALDGE
jgi:hypothetical protein